MEPREQPAFLVLTPSLDGADGLSELSRQIVRTLAADAGDDAVEVWALAGGRPPNGRGLRFRSARRNRIAMAAWTCARAINRLDGLTVVVTHIHLAPLASILASRGARLVLFLIGIEVWKPLRRRERYALEHAARAIAISRYTAQRFRDANPHVRVGDLVVCPLGIGDLTALPADPSGDGFALIVGRLWSEERYKGHDWLIDVWPAVRARVPGARLVVVGDGDDRGRLEARAAAAGAADAIRFLGRVDNAMLGALYRECAFFVMPSSGEGFGLVYLEAMRAAKPCIALHGAADEILEQGISGYLVGRGETERLVDAVVKLFTDGDLRARMGAAARLRVERDFTDAHFARRFRAAMGLDRAGAPIGAAPQTSAAGLR